ncbi:MAG: biotin--[acetyl-CoA-carboxylase] ligase [Acidimicrobiia bacterium]
MTAWTILHVAETGSTNADLLAMAPVDANGASGAADKPGPAADKTVLIADHQTAGRGRLDRTWEAPAGASLLMSILLRDVPPEGPHRLTQQLAVAAARACERLAGLTPAIKWPNDLLVGDGKLAGILAQAGIANGRVDHVVIGIGMNLRWAPDGAAKLGDVDRDTLVDAILAELDAVQAQPDGGALEYRRRLTTIGNRIRAELPGETIEGVAADVLPDGRLVIVTSAGERVIDSGDVIYARPPR